MPNGTIVQLKNLPLGGKNRIQRGADLCRQLRLSFSRWQQRTAGRNVFPALVASGSIRLRRAFQPSIGQPARIDRNKAYLIRHIAEVLCQMLARSSRQQMEIQYATVGIQLGERRKWLAQPEAPP